MQAVLSPPIWNSRNLADLMSFQGATHDQYLAFERVFQPLRRLSFNPYADMVTVQCVVAELAFELNSFPRSLREELLSVVAETIDIYGNPEIADVLIPSWTNVAA